MNNLMNVFIWIVIQKGIFKATSLYFGIGKAKSHLSLLAVEAPSLDIGRVLMSPSSPYSLINIVTVL